MPQEAMSQLFMMVALLAVFYFMMIRPQQKRAKQEKQMREALQVGDEITTLGGILGKVSSIKEDSLTIEVGADKTKLKIAKWAIKSVDTIHD